MYKHQGYKVTWNMREKRDMGDYKGESAVQGGRREMRNETL